MITAHIPATFNHHAMIYQPSKFVALNDKYIITMPAYYGPFDECPIKTVDQRTGKLLPEPIVFASSNKPPVIMVGDGSHADVVAWAKLTDLATRWRVPLDTLLRDRPLKVACDLWTPNDRQHQAISLYGVQILGDLDKSPALDERIAEIKGWFA